MMLRSLAAVAIVAAAPLLAAPALAATSLADVQKAAATSLADVQKALVATQTLRADFVQTAAEMTKLMGKGEAASRRELMELHGDAVEIDI